MLFAPMKNILFEVCSEFNLSFDKISIWIGKYSNCYILRFQNLLIEKNVHFTCKCKYQQDIKNVYVESLLMLISEGIYVENT